jgi:hypothetical protein
MKRNDLLYELEKYSRFLEAEGYLDTDWYVGEPTALQRYSEHLDSLNEGKGQ